MPKAKKKPVKKKGRKRKTIIAKASIRRLLKEHGADRVSETAITEVQHQMDEAAKKAVKLARHGKRKTVMRRDIPTINGVQ